MSLGEPGERLRSGWCNLYLQGWYHRAGKAGTMTLHPGDLYPTKEAALADIDPGAPYMTTAFIQWEEPGGYVTSVYPEGAQPVPLATSRKSWELLEVAASWRGAAAEVLVGQSNPEAELSLETGESDAIDPPHGWKVGRNWATPRTPFPAEGNIP